MLIQKNFCGHFRDMFPGISRKKDNSPQFSFPSDFIKEFVFSLPF